MEIIDQAKTWLLSVALKKAVVKLIQLGVSYGSALILGTPALLALAVSLTGAPVSQEALQLALTALFNSGFEMLRNYLKLKWPSTFGML